MSARRIALLTVLLGLLPTAAALAQQAAPSGDQGETVRVAVDNRAAGDVRVYALQDGHMVPLGLVPSRTSSTLVIPHGFLRGESGIQLVAERIGGSAWYKSDPIDVRPPRELALTVQEEIQRSTVSVRG